jgi:hypothetical protein
MINNNKTPGNKMTLTTEFEISLRDAREAQDRLADNRNLPEIEWTASNTFEVSTEKNVGHRYMKNLEEDHEDRVFEILCQLNGLEFETTDL